MSVSPVSCRGNVLTVMILSRQFPSGSALIPPSHPSQFLLGKGVLVAMLSDSPSAPGREVFCYEVLFKHEPARDRKQTLKNPRRPNTQWVETETPLVILTHHGSVPSVPYQGAPQCLSLRPQFRSATAPSAFLNQELERFLLFLLIQVPLTGLRFFSHGNWIFPKLQIFRAWLLVSPTSRTAKGFQKVKYCHLSPVDIYGRADFQHEDPLWYRSAFLNSFVSSAWCSCKGLH